MLRCMLLLRLISFLRTRLPTNYGWSETSGGANAWSFLVSDVVGTGTGTGTLDHILLLPSDLDAI